VAIIGAGSIGIAFAIVFARAGMRVRLYDPDPDRLAQADEQILERGRALQTFDLLDEPAEALLTRIEVFDTLSWLLYACGLPSYAQNTLPHIFKD
jgi:3-hydroxyacyl-CoA dehydrogenase